MYRSFNPDKELRKIQSNKTNKILVTIIIVLIIITIGTSFALYQVQNKQDIIFTKVGDFSGDYTIAAYIDEEKVSLFPQKWEGYYVDKIVCNNDAVGVWDYNGWGVKITNTKASGTRCNIYFSGAYKDNSGANYPELVDNMIPIIYDGSNWKYADIGSDAWYNYDAKEWANAVVLNDGVEKSVGESITEEEISLWYVWIPRYTYIIFNGNNGSVEEQEIQIKFESGTNSSGTVECVDNVTGNGTSSETCTDTTNGSIINGTSTYTHPAFTFGDTELTGFWVGKFEVSGTTDKIEIKPNVTSLKNTSISAFFNAIQNIGSIYNLSGDSHMVRNMEWGAVAYLSHSKYGTCTDGTCIKVNRNNNSAYITGYSAVHEATKGWQTGDVSSPENEYGTSSSVTQPYNTSIGVKASTTQNIYGVYDMSGGAWEYVMGNSANNLGGFNTGMSGFEGIIKSKYYDIYTFSNTTFNNVRSKLGDGMKETLKEFGINYGGWYSNSSSMAYNSYPWIARGLSAAGGINTGIFVFGGQNGSNIGYVGSRAAFSAF